MTPARVKVKRDSLAHRIALLRQQLGLTQAAFAQRVGVSRGTIGLYEAGTLAPRARTLDRIAEVGGVTVDWLVRGDRPVAIPPARDPAWGEAVAWLRQAWRDPGRREMVSRCSRRWRRRLDPPGPADALTPPPPGA